MPKSRLPFLVAVGAMTAATLASTGAGPATAEPTSPVPSWLRVEQGMTQPVSSLEAAIEEKLYVETTTDSDLDGKRDRVHLALSRPAETRTKGAKVPVIFEHSPYRSGAGGGVNHNVDFDFMPQEYIRPRTSVETGGSKVAKANPDLPGRLDDYWVPRGYAVVLGESVGTGLSEGCPTSGDESETLGTKAIIDWLNGRAKAWDEAGNPVTADWTTGKVGMVGTSYNGTLPNQVATTGVEGLETIVPTSAISSWYDYYRANGLVVAPHSEESGADENAYLGEDLDVLAEFVGGPSRMEKCAHIYSRMKEEQDRTTGDYSAYWKARDYLPKAGRVRASVFVVHGLEDYNVKTKAFAAWWSRLASAGVTRKIWLHKGGHGGPGSASGYQETLNKWMDYWLYDIDNGILDEPRADIERPDGTYQKYATWPVPRASSTDLRLSRFTTPSGQGRSFVDRGRELDTDTALLPSPDTAHPNRLAYLTPALEKDLHFSGTPRISLRASVDNRYAANLTAVLVDYAPDGTPTMVTRGWMDVQNRRSVSTSTPIVQGRAYTFTWDLQADDYVVPKGHRLGVVVLSTDHDYTVRPLPGTRLTVDPARSSLRLPIVRW